MILIPKGKLANSDASLKKKREELRKKLLEGKSITINQDGKVDGKNGGGIAVPKGKLANPSDDALKRKCEELRKKLLEGKSITINQDGKVDGKNGGGIAVPKGKLASFYWYERDPELLKAEKYAMNKFFPNFELSKDDGRLNWIGTINTGLMGNNVWTLQIVYDNDYPVSRMGGSVKIYAIDPDIDEMAKKLDWRPHHLLTDTSGNTYMCTAESKDVKTGKTVTSAATTLSWAVKWIMVFELVLSGEITTAEFDARTF